MCNLTPQTLVAITNDTNAQFKWYQNNNLIPSATTNTYTATDPGIYKVEVYIPNNNCPGEATVEIIGGTFPTVSSSVLKKCATTPNATTATFNLTEAESALSSTPGVTFRYYLTESYALAGNNIFIKNPAAFNSVTTRLYVRVSNGDCAKVTELDLVVNPMPPKPTITKSANSICAETPVILTSSSPTGNLWSTGETTQSISVTTPGVYTLTYKDGNNCQSPSSFVVISKTENPNVQISGNLVFCEGSSTTLTSSSTTGNEWSTGETTQSIIVNTPGIYTVTVTTESGCTFSESVNVTETGATTVNIAAPQKITCTVDQVMLDATTSVYEEGSTFLWAASNGGNIVSGGNTLQPIVNKAGTYTLTITGTVCTASKSVVVTADMSVTAPVITANRNIICPGETVTLTSSYATGNVWSTGATTQSITVSSAGTYTLKTNVGSCTSATVSYTVTSATDPNIQISGNLSFCEGSSTVLTSSVANGNIWSNGETTQSITVTAPGVYTVQVTTSQGCTFEKSVTVTSVPKTIVNIATPQQITCTVSQITLDASTSIYQSESAFLWTASNGGNIVSGANTLKPIVNKAGTYTLKITGSVCNATESVIVTADMNVEAPLITASQNILCPGGTVTLTSSYATGNVWSTGETTKSITVSTAGTYTLKTTVGTCTSATVSHTVTAATDPNIQISGNLSFCEGSSTVLTSSVANGNIWSNGETTQSITVTAPGVYTVQVTTAQGCTFEKSVTVTRIPKTIVNIAATQQITCTVTQITLDATASVYQTGSTFAWTASNGGNIVSGGNTLQPVVNKAGTYTLLISGHCPESKTVTVTEDTNAPTVSFNASATSICVGEGVTLSVSGASNYVWSNQLGTSSTIAVSPTETTTYTVTATGSNGCTTTESITITVVPKVISSLPQISGQMCSGDAILLDAGAGPNYTYLWSTGENTQTISANQVGEYSVTISNGVCSETFTTEILQTQLPTITEIIYANNEVRIIAVNNSEGELEYSLDGYSWQSSPIFFNVQPNIVVNASVRIKTTSCLVSTEYFTFKMANVLTPNGDGRNDVVDFTGISYYTNFTAIIYDRNGEVVYKADNNRTVWDGKEFGRPLPTSSYWYTVIWDDPVTQVTQTKIGWILLKND